MFKRQLMTYDIFKRFNPGADDDDEVQEYAMLVGKKSAENMVLVRK